MKLTKRKAFNFLRSYFDVLNKLQTDEDKLSFLISIIDKQFLNENPKDLKFPVDLAYDSQFNAIDSSVKGWIRASKTDLKGNSLNTPPTPPKGETNIDPKEEKEKEEVQEEEEVDDVTKFYSVEKLESIYIEDEKLVKAVLKNKDNKFKDKAHLEKRLKQFKNELIEQGRSSETKLEFNKYFRNWHKRTASIKKSDSDNPSKNVVF